MKRAFEAMLSALCTGLIRAHFRAPAGERGPARDRTVQFVSNQAARMPDYLQLPLMILTFLLDFSGGPGRRLRSLDPGRLRARIEKARNSRFGPVRDLIRYYEGLTVFGFYDELMRCATDGADLDKPAAPAIACADSLAAGRCSAPDDLPAETRTEIAVIGSGPGGAITACLLAEAGRDVILIESGSSLPLQEQAQFGRAEMETKYRNGGVTAALGRTKISYVEARCVGGGSEINAGLYHRTPEEMLDRWRREYLLDGAGLTDMTPHFEACEADVSVSYMPHDPPAASVKLHEGARRKGWQCSEVPRWFKYQPQAAGSIGSRQSMGQTFIPRAVKAGCTLVPNVTARRLSRRGSHWIVDAERAAYGTQPTQHRFVCESLFVCGGAIQTPALLLASGIGRHPGRSLRMHPTVKVVARFPERVNSELMGIPVHQVKEFSPRLSFGCSISSAPHLALGLLDHPSHIAEVASDWPRMASYYAMTVGGKGMIRKLPYYDDAVVGYKLTDTDMCDLADGLRKLCELLFAAGAERLYPSVQGLAPLSGPDDLQNIPTSLPHGRTSLMSVHLFSSCPMGEDQSRCVADSFGRVHGQENLYIADASLLCTAPGVNPQGSVMGFARRNALHFLRRDP